MNRAMRWLVVALVSGLLACATTVLATWKKPGTGPLDFKKVAIIAPAKDPSYRRSTEDLVARRLRAWGATPSYSVLQGIDENDRQAIRARLKDEGFDGAVVIRVASVDKEAKWVPDPGPGYAFGYGAWPAYDYGHTEVDTYVRVETNIYSLGDDQLIFAASSRTANPQNVRELVDETLTALADELKKEGLTPIPVAAADETESPATAER